MLRILVAVSALIAVATAGAVSFKQSPFGVVGGIKDCGSAGKLGDVFVPDCTQTPCHLVPGTNYDIAVRFTAETTSTYLSLRVYHADSETLLFNVDINGEIQAGIEYELKFILPVTDVLAGTAFDIRFYILDLLSHKIEVCASAALTIGWETK